MKKIVCFITLAVLSINNIYAQLRITSEGNALLARRYFTNGVKLNISEGNAVFNGEKLNLYCNIDKLSPYHNMGVSSIVSHNYLYPLTGNPYAIALYGCAKGSPCGRNFGVIGNLGDGEGAGVYGTIGMSSNFAMNGSYAGYFNGETEVVGNLYASSFLTSSDIRLKENVEYIGNNNRSVSTLENVMKLNVIRFNYKLRKACCVTPEVAEKEGAEALGLEDTNEKELELLEKLHSQKHYGLSAQELREVYPDLVTEDQNGYLSVNYVELVPLLLQCIQEMQLEIEELQGGTDTQRKVQRNEMATGTSPAKASANMLFQNRPNPFKEQTEISFSLADGVKDASICIFDMQGKMLKSYPVQSGMKSVTVNGYELGAGMFLYSLVVNGQEVDTKKMILSK